MSKQYAVIGLGKFGFSVATTLAQAGKEVLAVDKDAEPVQEIADLVTYAVHAWESGWGYVWGTYGNELTESLLAYKVSQYPDGVGNHENFIRAHWLGGRTTDCVGLIKGYSWLSPETMTIDYGTHGMPDIGANQMYYSATESGTIDTMPDIPGLAVWHDGHKVSSIFAVGIGKSRDVQVDTASISAKELTVVIPAARSAGDHGIDVVDIALVVLCDRPAKLCFQIGICLIQRDRNSDGVFFCTGDRTILALHFYRAGTGFPSVEALYKAVCCPSVGSIVAKAESIKNSLDSDQVKAVSTFRPHIDGGDRRIQKRKSGAHILNMRTECHRHLGRIARSIEGCGYRLVVVIRTACADGAHRGDQEDDGRENSDQPPADPFAELLVGKGCCRDFGDHTCCYCHQRPPAVPNSFSL